MAGLNYLGASSVLIAGLVAAGPSALADTAVPVLNATAPAARGDSALVLAARYGQRDTVRLLLDQGTAVDSRDGLGRTALIAAAGEKDKDMVALLLSRGASVAATDADGATALLHAATKGYLDNVRLLLEAGAAIEAVDGNGETALTSAVRFDHVAVVDYLLGHGADPNHYTPGEKNAGYTPLMRAVARDVPATDGLALVRSLLGKGAEPNVARANGETALSLARRNGADAAAEELLRHGARDETPYASLSPEQTLFKAIKLGDADKAGALLAGAVDPNYRDPLTGVTPLASAAYYGSIGLMELLIDHGADIDNVPWGLSEQRIEVSSVPVRERDLLRLVASGDSALLTSVRRGDLDAVWALLDKGADIRLPNRNGDTPALVAARNGQADIMRALLTKGLDPNAVAPVPARGYVISSLVNKGTPPTLLMEAVRNDRAELCAILLEAGAQPDVTDSQGKTALYWAVADGHTDVVAALLTHGADPNIATRSGSTPLMVAAQNGSDAIAQALLEHGAGVNAIGGEAGSAAGGMTALMYAARGGHAAIVGLLLQRGADPRLHAANGEEAVDTARENGHADVVNLLTAAVAE